MNKKNFATHKINVEARALLQDTSDFSITITDKKDLVLQHKKEKYIVRAHPDGILIHIYKNGDKKNNMNVRDYGNNFDDTIILPGEIGFSQLTAYLNSTVGIHFKKQKLSRKKAFESADDYYNHQWREQQLQISQGLLESGVWKRRGYADKVDPAPKEFWKKLSVNTMIVDKAHLGSRHLWKNYLQTTYYNFFQQNKTSLYAYNTNSKKKIHGEDKESIVNKELLNEALRQNLLPDVPWSIRRWNNFDLNILAKHAMAGTYRSKKWAYFATNCTMFQKSLDAHNILTSRIRESSPNEKMRDMILEFLEHWPKTKNGVASLEEAFNQGIDMPVIIALKPKSPKELKEYITVYRQIVDTDRYHLNETYEPPKVHLKPGYKYVDHTDAHLMSDKYDCCFSNSEMYINAIVEGTAFAVCRPNFGKGDLGCLTFFELRGTEWVISQNKSHGNHDPIKEYTSDMVALSRAMAITHPEPFPEVSQDPNLLFNKKNGLGKKYNEVFHLLQTEINRDYGQLREKCDVQSITELHKINGKQLNVDEFIWENVGEKEIEKFANLNNDAEKIFQRLEKIIAEDRKNVSIEIKKPDVLALEATNLVQEMGNEVPFRGRLPVREAYQDIPF